jgi:hypothetical protein
MWCVAQNGARSGQASYDTWRLALLAAVNRMEDDDFAEAIVYVLGDWRAVSTKVFTRQTAMVDE